MLSFVFDIGDSADLDLDKYIAELEKVNSEADILTLVRCHSELQFGNIKNAHEHIIEG